MKSEKQVEYITRDTILGFLSDHEFATMNAGESATQLPDGEEYVDLERLDMGIRQSHGAESAPMGQVVSRSAVHENTWRRISGLLEAYRPEARGSAR